MRGTHIVAAVSAVLLAACAPTVAQASPPAIDAPPSVCEIQQAVWCLLYSDATYEDRPSGQEAYASQWIVRGGTWQTHPLVINEPRGCRRGQSDTVELVSYERNVSSGGRNVNKMIVKLKQDGSCNLELLSPTLKEDPQAGAFFAGLTLIRPCRDTSCEGRPIAIWLRNLVEP